MKEEKEAGQILSDWKNKAKIIEQDIEDTFDYLSVHLALLEKEDLRKEMKRMHGSLIELGKLQERLQVFQFLINECE